MDAITRKVQALYHIVKCSQQPLLSPLHTLKVFD